MSVRVEDAHDPSDGDGADAVTHDKSRSGNLFI